MKISRIFDRFFAGIAPGAAYEHACRLLEGGEAARGFALLGQMARDGMAQAQFRVAQAYLDGLGTAPSVPEGARWLRRGAQAGHPESCFAFGMLLLLDIAHTDPARTLLPGGDAPPVPAHDPVEATRWIGRAAELGLPDAQALYGHLLAHGPEEVRDLAAAREWSTLAAEAGCAQGYLGLGLARLDTDAAAAMDALHKAAAEGLGSACYVLGMLHETGRGGEIDLAAAARMYQQAAEQDIRPACARYGMALLRGRGVARDVLRAETWLRRAALQGDREAAIVVGDLHARGIAEMASDHEAMSWYRRAAQAGRADACRMMAVMCMSGRGLPAPDPRAAAHWLRRAVTCGDGAATADLAAVLDSMTGGPGPDAIRDGDEGGHDALTDGFARAADAGDPVAAFNYAKCLLEGFGHAPDPAHAAHWMQHAAQAGVVNAQYWYGRMLLGGQGVAADPVAARHWIMQAARAGMAEAQAAAAQMHVTGQGGPRDHDAALALYHQAAQQGQADAMFSLGAMYGGGHDIPTDRTQAQHWFTQGAQGGNALAQLMLGRYLARGLAGTADPARARLWLQRAQAQGVTQAAQDLARLPAATADAAPPAGATPDAPPEAQAPQHVAR
ncbi:sel1 repeat family protein [Gluconacetobacter entanii]|uniref:Sel1 repeat family protein n=1 Tax=Gluconacetobacter entanii TaxID=108528 RepID=A0ABT3K549_9PROT|nr:tetratricopeptide repeat protein [Gluconacetobacter entanii]MCW4590530.1 sel1 repeat family protein [Gluconacetobacter entanii]MCW4594047.1 sel1 repeat family protein [Gluconacetobacter entanii]NPC89138.1 sel1 repeat family protein [Gluconacetobacter entanii]